jgi:hypothetical protein
VRRFLYTIDFDKQINNQEKYMPRLDIFSIASGSTRCSIRLPHRAERQKCLLQPASEGKNETTIKKNNGV